MSSSTWSSLTRKPHSLGAVVPPGDHLGSPRPRSANTFVLLLLLLLSHFSRVQLCAMCSGTQSFWHQRPVLWKIIFSHPGWGSWFQDNSSALCTLRKWWASLVAQTVKRLPAVRETRVRSLGWEDPLEKKMATHSSTLAWKIPWTEEPGRLQSTGSTRVGHN